MNSKPEESEEVRQAHSEEEEGEENGEETEGAEVTGEAPSAAKTEPAAVQEIKLVINLKGNRAVIGVQATGCDPVFETAEGNMAEILVYAEGLLDVAREKWKSAPRNPKSSLPQPAVPAPTLSSTGTAAAKAKPAPKTQNALF